ncbi:hypothetical protein [Aquibium sp. ELW1220]|uniref:hypothetical protein n=1 Tax=Aquibium sp. ELW1220 TaxID=2976766 RepID=UPI0025AEE669|nr:hypothetical protein [Aquibium sp. ELW1220]MDN2581679.1 hypothetical protein [Aquibium sp. ELW1220]
MTARSSGTWVLPASPAGGAEGGFALVELLVSLALVATMAALIALFIGQLRGFSATAERLAVAREAQAVSAYVEGLLERAKPLPLLSGRPAERRFLVGTATDVRFSAIARTGHQRQSLREVEIATTDAEVGAAISQVLRPRRFGVPVRGIAVQTETLLPAQARIRFRYLGWRGAEDVWSDDWNELAALPRAISIIVTLQRDGRTYEARSLAILHLSRPEP